MKRTIVAVMFGLVVLTGCGGAAEEPPSVVLPQESMSSVTDEPTVEPSSSPTPAPAQRKVPTKSTPAPAPVVEEDPKPQADPVAPKEREEAPESKQESTAKPAPVNTPGVPNPKLPDAEYYSDRGSCEARGFVWTPRKDDKGREYDTEGDCSDPED